MMIKLPKKNVNLKQFFIKNGLKEVYNESVKKNLLNKNDKRLSSAPYSPDLLDLYYIYELVRLNNRTTVLEYGCGWSTLIIHFALLNVKSKKKNKIYKRCFNPYELHSVDNSKKYISIAKKRVRKFSNSHNLVKFNFSKVIMTKFCERYCTQYENHPLINPDFIYIDGPDQFEVKKNINNFTVNSKSMMPMLSDVLKYEHFLTPGTIILFDGRQSNVRFIKANLQRKWNDIFINSTGQHIFYLNERPLGQHNKNQIKFYNNK